jgi:hypothetical protein
MSANFQYHRTFALILMVLSLASFANAYEFGPPPSRTGAPAIGGKPAEGLCNECHVDASVNSSAGSMRWLDLPSYYVPGRTYVLRLRLTHAWAVAPISPRWGFQAQAIRLATGDSSGVWTVTAPDSIQLVPPTAQSPEFAARRYIQHALGGIQEGAPGPSVEWVLRWTAPLTNEGIVRFQAVGNAASGDNLPYFDHLYTAVDSLAPLPGVGVGDPAAVWPGSSFAPPSPQPTRERSALRFRLDRTEAIEFAIFDAQGRRLRTLATGAFAPGDHRLEWDGRDDAGREVGPGVYLASLRSLAGRGVLSQRIHRIR